MLRVAVLSVHTCPLAPLGGWETGGMNVYVRELSRGLGRLGVKTDVFTRRQDPDVPTVVEIGEHARVIHVDAGAPRHRDKYAVVDDLPELACNIQRYRNHAGARYDLIHSHYWLSGRLATLFKEHWRAPVVAMFHTLGALKNKVAVDSAELEQQIRVDIERRTMATADRIVAATDVDRNHMLDAYDANPRKIVVVPGGVNLDLFSPGDRQAARRTLGLGPEPTLLFVGRIQRLKGIDILIRAAAELRDDIGGLRVLVVGGTDDAPGRQALRGGPRASAYPRPGPRAQSRRRRSVRRSSRSAAPAGVLPRRRRHRHAVDLRVVRPGRGGVDGLWDAGRRIARWRAGDDRA